MVFLGVVLQGYLAAIYVYMDLGIDLGLQKSAHMEPNTIPNQKQNLTLLKSVFGALLGLSWARFH